jgi:hypothetical protein
VEKQFLPQITKQCASSNDTGLMAPELPARARIHMSGTSNEGLSS